MRREGATRRTERRQHARGARRGCGRREAQKDGGREDEEEGGRADGADDAEDDLDARDCERDEEGGADEEERLGEQARVPATWHHGAVRREGHGLGMILFVRVAVSVTAW